MESVKKNATVEGMEGTAGLRNIHNVPFEMRLKDICRVVELIRIFSGELKNCKMFIKAKKCENFFTCPSAAILLTLSLVINDDCDRLMADRLFGTGLYCCRISK